MKKSKVITRGVLAGAALFVLAACGSMNKIDSQGNIVNQDVRWGNIQRTTFKTNGTQPGMWVSQSDLALLQPGMNKSQLYQLLGRPHYHEGFVGVREWNYVINFNTPDGGVKHCQLKVTFDSKMNARQFIWSPDCQPQAKAEEPAPQPVVIEEPKQRFELRSDFLFDFDKATIRPAGVERLNQIVRELSQNSYDQVVVVGHTDRLGSEQYNEKLSERRAIAVSRHLINKGVPSNKIRAYGAGESQQVKECAGARPTAQLKACLEPNRRVEILVH